MKFYKQCKTEAEANVVYDTVQAMFEWMRAANNTQVVGADSLAVHSNYTRVGANGSPQDVVWSVQFDGSMA